MGKDKPIEPPAALVTAQASSDPPAPLPPGPKTIKVPQSDGQIGHYDGDTQTVYKVNGGEIVVADAHVAAVLASVEGSELKPEAPAKEK